jgi:outer membrane protein TolC
VSGGDLVALPRSTENEVRSGDVSLRYQLYDSGLRQASARSAQANLRAAEFGEQDTRQLVIANVADNYFNVLRNEALVRVSQSQVTRAQNTLDVVTAQVEVGQAARVDVFQVRADLLNAQVNLLQARNNADIADAQLKNSIGIVGGGRLTLADVPTPAPNTPATATLAAAAGTNAPAGGGQVTPTSPATTGDEAALNDFIALAYQARPDIARSTAGLDVNRADVRLARINSGVLLTTDTALGFQFSPNTGNNREITAQISYPLFDAGASRAQVRAAQSSQRASELRLESLRQQVAVEVEQAYRQLAQARASIPAAQAAQEAAQINFEAATESRREGVGDIIDVITAQTLLVQAQTNFVQAVYDFYVADAQLARAVGQAERLVQR